MLLSMMVFAGLVFTAVRHRDLPVGRALHDVLIAGPADWLMRTPPRRLFIILVLLIGASLVWMEIAPLLVAADLAPVLWFADMSLYLDALLMVGVALAAVQVKSVGRLLSGSLRRVGGVRPFWQRARSRASAPRRPKRLPPANDDAPGLATRWAA
jgi:hypothetical protein